MRLTQARLRSAPAAAHPQSGWIFSAAVPRRPRREPGEGLLLHAAHKSPGALHTVPHSQIRPGRQCVAATQKEGEPWMPLALLALPLLCAHKTRKYPNACSHSSSFMLSALTCPGSKTGHQVSSDSSKGGSPPAAMPKSLLTCEPTRPSPLLIDFFRSKGDKPSGPSIPRCLLVTKPTAGPPYSPLPAREFSSEYGNQVFKNYA